MTVTRQWIACVAFLCLLGGAAVRAEEPKPLIDFSAGLEGLKLNHQDAESSIVQTDAGPALEVKVGHVGGSYPAVHFEPSGGTWDLSGYGTVEMELVNTGSTRVRMHGRVDNPGSWKDQPWSVNAVSLKPGEKKTLSVPFGKSYGNPAYALDPSKIKRVVIFAEKPKGEATVQVLAIRAAGTASAGGGASQTATAGESGGGQAAAEAPESNMLYDFEGDVDQSLLVDNDTRHEIVDVDGGKALRVTFTGGKYPGVQLNAPGGGWNLSNFAGVEAEFTNPGSEGVTVALRIDNPGSWKDQPWNVEKTHLKPGQTKTLRVKFGQSWGASGFALNPAKVVRVLTYAERPKAGAELRIDNVRAYGQPTVREKDTVSLDGTLFDFGPDFVLEGRADERGAKASVANGRLEIAFGTGESYPGVAMMPVAKQWDLANFASIQADVTNLGDASVRIGMRVDNPGGHTESNAEISSIPAGQTKTLKVTFGQSWGQQGYALDPAKVVSVLFYADKPKGDARIAVDNVRANAKEWAEVPEWIGQRPPVEGSWVQTLNENFDGSSLDESLWTPRLVWDGPAKGELQRFRKENVIVRDGKLIIRCEKNPGHQYDDPKLETRQYATGAVTSLSKWTQKYGYMEARIKRPTARGLWPAFWLMPDRGEGNGNIWERRSTNNGGMEIDIWEHLTEWGPHRYNIAAHWDGYGKEHKQWGNSHIYHLPTEDGWHNYGLLWEPGKLTWFADGKKVAEWKDEQVTDVPLYIKFTVQMGNWATKDVDDAALPDEFQIEYVRAWQLSERVTQ